MSPEQYLDLMSEIRAVHISVICVLLAVGMLTAVMVFRRD